MGTIVCTVLTYHHHHKTVGDIHVCTYVIDKPQTSPGYRIHMRYICPAFHSERHVSLALKYWD